MSWENSVRVVDEHGRPMRGVEVYISLNQAPIFNFHESQWTDDDGWVTFEWIVEEDTLEMEYLYIDGDLVDGGFDIDNGDTRSYVLKV